MSMESQTIVLRQASDFRGGAGRAARFSKFRQWWDTGHCGGAVVSVENQTIALRQASDFRADAERAACFADESDVQ